MNIPFEAGPPPVTAAPGLERVDKSWGYEELVYNGLYCAKLLVYTRAGVASSRHYHESKTETFIVTLGKFLIEIGTPETPVVSTEIYTPGESITLPPRIVHRVRCL